MKWLVLGLALVSLLAGVYWFRVNALSDSTVVPPPTDSAPALAPRPAVATGAAAEPPPRGGPTTPSDGGVAMAPPSAATAPPVLLNGPGDLGHPLMHSAEDIEAHLDSLADAGTAGVLPVEKTAVTAAITDRLKDCRWPNTAKHAVVVHIDELANRGMALVTSVKAGDGAFENCARQALESMRFEPPRGGSLRLELHRPTSSPKRRPSGP